jgi:hypothetical protein
LRFRTATDQLLEVQDAGGEQCLHLHLGSAAELCPGEAMLLLGIGVDALVENLSASEQVSAAPAPNALLHLIDHILVPASADASVGWSGSAS